MEIDGSYCVVERRHARYRIKSWSMCCRGKVVHRTQNWYIWQYEIIDHVIMINYMTHTDTDSCDNSTHTLNNNPSCLQCLKYSHSLPARNIFGWFRGPTRYLIPGWCKQSINFWVLSVIRIQDWTHWPRSIPVSDKLCSFLVITPATNSWIHEPSVSQEALESDIVVSYRSILTVSCEIYIYYFSSMKTWRQL